MENLYEYLGLSPLQVRVFEYVIMGLGQAFQSWFRSWNIKSLATNNKLHAHISWQLYGWVWLSSLTLGLKQIYDGDVLGIFIFFVSGAIGLEISMRTKSKK